MREFCPPAALASAVCPDAALLPHLICIKTRKLWLEGELLFVRCRALVACTFHFRAHFLGYIGSLSGCLPSTRDTRHIRRRFGNGRYRRFFLPCALHCRRRGRL